MDPTKARRIPIENPTLSKPTERDMDTHAGIKAARKSMMESLIPLHSGAAARPDPKLARDLLEHRAAGHLSLPHLPNIGAKCPECSLTKGGRASVTKIRP